MKLSFLFTILPFVAAAYDSVNERGDNLVVDLLGAANEGPLVLADLDRRNDNQPAYCRGTKNFNCYRNGYPKCCTQTKGNCPANSVPGCEGYRNVPGNGICTYSPDYNCYKSGWPKCCTSTTFLCPSFQPVCDNLPGANYCTQSPNYNCYRTGRPDCCSQNGGVNCPKTKPGCNVEDTIDMFTEDEEIIVDTPAAFVEEYGSDSPEDMLDESDGPFVLADLDRRDRNQPGYCYGRTNYNCYRNGYPKCCSQTKGNCPMNNKPGCDSSNSRNRNVGKNYCTDSPDYNCYRKGWPKCCRSNGGDDCPSRKPGCDDDDENESLEQDHFLRG